jgi:hypothetical protein
MNKFCHRSIFDQIYKKLLGESCGLKMRKAIRFLLFFVFYGMCVSVAGQSGNDPLLPPGSRPPSLRDLHMQNNRQLELGITIGNTYGLHDLSGDPLRSVRLFIWDTQWDMVNLHFGLFGRYRLNQNFAIKGVLNYGKISSSHTFFSPGTRQHDLGYSFQNHIIELAALPEVILPRIAADIPFDIYGFLGLALYYHNPKVGSQGLVPRLDGVRHIGIGIPMGAGFYYTLMSHHRLGGSIGWRKTFTDVLDGYESGTGMDSYFFVAVHFGFLLESWRNRPVKYD